MSDSLTTKYFDDVYAANRDPWGFESSAYEKNKFARTVESLPQAHYTAGFEIGCSIGVLSEKLASRCESLLSVDVAERALECARERYRDIAHLRFQKMSVPGEFPAGVFDLIVVSEVAYYFALPDLDRLIDRIASAQHAGADLLLVHFTPFVPDYPLTGDAVHERFLQRSEWTRLHESREERYRIDVLRRN